MDCALVSSYYLNMVLGHKGCPKIMNSFLVPCLDCVSTSIIIDCWCLLIMTRAKIPKPLLRFEFMIEIIKINFSKISSLPSKYKLYLTPFVYFSAKHLHLGGKLNIFFKSWYVVSVISSNIKSDFCILPSLLRVQVATHTILVFYILC